MTQEEILTHNWQIGDTVYYVEPAPTSYITDNITLINKYIKTLPPSDIRIAKVSRIFDTPHHSNTMLKVIELETIGDHIYVDPMVFITTHHDGHVTSEQLRDVFFDKESAMKQQQEMQKKYLKGIEKIKKKLLDAVQQCDNILNR